MLIVIMALTFGSVSTLCRFILIPPVADRFSQSRTQQSKDIVERMDRIFMRDQTKKILFIYTFGPFGLAGLGFLFTPEEFRLLGCILGVMLGSFIPTTVVKTLEQKRRDKFNDQLVDPLMIMSSALKGGLSLIQAMEVVVEEMPEPTDQELGILLGENKMGIPLEEAFAHLYHRMPSVALQQTITTILLARETGGNLPFIFGRIVGTIRENKKLRQNLSNLTLQGRIQGFVMSLLPVGFSCVVLSTNPRFFDSMLETEIGRQLLVACVILELMGAFLIWKISSFRDF